MSIPIQEIGAELHDVRRGVRIVLELLTLGQKHIPKLLMLIQEQKAMPTHVEKNGRDCGYSAAEPPPGLLL